MGTQGAILEGLRAKKITTVNISDNMNRKPRLALQLIGEKKRLHFIKESIRDVDEMPMGKLKDQIIVCSNGDKYVGDIWDRLPDGQGTVASNDGDMYTGSWKKGTPHGAGTYIWEDGCIFVGMWKNGERHGKGTYYTHDKEYAGEWENGELLNTEGSICDKSAH